MNIAGIFVLLITSMAITQARATTCRDVFAGTSEATNLSFYNQGAANYNKTRAHVSRGLAQQRALFQMMLPSDARILEIGAGHGRDALYFLEQGYDVVATEPAAELAKFAEEKIKRPVLVMRAQDIIFEKEFDGVWATASLIHVPPMEMQLVFEKLRRAVKVGGVIHASFLEGVGQPDRPETIGDGRYFNRASENFLRNIISMTPGLRILHRTTNHQRDDYFGKNAPSSTFGFFNLYVVREY